MNGGARAVPLGWGNATPRQLVLYERLYRTLGLEASSVIPDTVAGLMRQDAYARSLAPLAAELAGEAGARPIVVHLFSDNGFIGWAELLQALSATAGGRRARDAVRGVISDSSPGLWNVRGRRDFARRFSLAMTPALSRVARLGVRETMPVVTPLLAATFIGYQFLFPRSVHRMMSAAGLIREHQPRCAHLYLYGEEDVLVPAHDVRAWVARQREAGVEVEQQAFAEGRHVALYPNDPRRYRAAISGFVARVLATAPLAAPGMRTEGAES